MANTTVYQAPKSERTYIHIEYHPIENQVSSEFQCDQLYEVKQLLCELQKATLAMRYFSIPQVMGITFKAIIQHIKQKLEMVFSQSI